MYNKIYNKTKVIIIQILMIATITRIHLPLFDNNWKLQVRHCILRLHDAQVSFFYLLLGLACAL